MDSDIFMFLAIFTLGAGLTWGLMSWLRAKRAKDHHEGAAVADRQRKDEAMAARDRHTRPDGRAEDFHASDGSGKNWSEEREHNPPNPNPPTPMPPRN